MRRITEKEMEDMIAEKPSELIGEEGLKLLARQYAIGKYRFDLLFEDRHGGKLIVELQRGALDREHMFKVLDYCDEYRDRNPSEFVEPLIISNIIPHERKRRLSRRGVAYKEIPEEIFLEYVKRVPSINVLKEKVPSHPYERASNAFEISGLPKPDNQVKLSGSEESASSINCYMIMTDTDARMDRRECDIWFETGYAFCGEYAKDYGKRRKNFAGLEPGDIMLVHENHGRLKKTGCKKIVGVGRVLEKWDEKDHKEGSMLFYTVEPGEDFFEYRIKVDWFADLRTNPVDPRLEGIHISPLTFRQISDSQAVDRILRRANA